MVTPNGDMFVRPSLTKGILPEILEELLGARKRWAGRGGGPSGWSRGGHAGGRQVGVYGCRCASVPACVSYMRVPACAQIVRKQCPAWLDAGRRRQRRCLGASKHPPSGFGPLEWPQLLLLLQGQG